MKYSVGSIVVINKEHLREEGYGGWVDKRSGFTNRYIITAMTSNNVNARSVCGRDIVMVGVYTDVFRLAPPSLPAKLLKELWRLHHE